MKIAIVAIIVVALAGILFAVLRDKREEHREANVDAWPPEVLAKVETDRLARERVRQQSPEFFAAISAAMFRHDPIGIGMGTNTDEYEAEAGTIIPRLTECSSRSDVARVLREEFTRWFGADTAGAANKYDALADDIWALWNERKTEQEDGERR